MKRLSKMVFFIALALSACLLVNCNGAKGNSGTGDPPASNSIITFSRQFGNTGTEAAYAGLETSDGSFVLAGVKSASTGSNLVLNSDDGHIIKTDGLGQLIWEKNFGGSQDDGFYDIKETGDGGLVAAGFTSSLANGALTSDAWLIKVDGNGNLLWQKTYDEGTREVARSISATSDGGFVLTGVATPDTGSRKIYVVHTDADGNKIWSHMYEIGSGDNTGYSIVEASNGDFVIVGQAFFGVPSGQEDIVLLRIDKDGNELWHKTFGGPYTDTARCLIRTSDNGFAIAGSIQNDMYSLDGTEMVLIRVDRNGDELWRKTYKGTNVGLRANSLQQTSDGSFILVGNNPFAVGGYNVILIKTDVNGNELWRTKYSGSAGAQGNAVRITADGGFAVMGVEFSLDWQGFYNSDALLLKTNLLGQTQ